MLTAMTHPANYVIVSGGEPRAYHDTLGALSCALDLLDGLGPCMGLVQDLVPVASVADAPSAEGGWLLDIDRQHAILFGTPRAPDASALGEKLAAEIEAAVVALGTDPARYLRQLAPAWPGWTLVWDVRGIDAFAEYLEDHGLGTTHAVSDSAGQYTEAHAG